MTEARYLTDDRDLPEDDLRELLIFQGGNGDWYIQIVRPGMTSVDGVRICTSGGASTAVPGLSVAVADAFRAIRAAKDGKRDIPPSVDDLMRELHAWRSNYPDMKFDGFFDIEEKRGPEQFAFLWEKTSERS